MLIQSNINQLIRSVLRPILQPILVLAIGLGSVSQAQETESQGTDTQKTATAETVTTETATVETEVQETEVQKADVEEAKAEMPAAEQSKLVRSIYEMTKTAKTAKELTAFVEKCELSLKQDLNKANHKYINSLCGWALNRRGNKRFEVGMRLKKIGNSQSAAAFKQAMEDYDSAVVRDSDRYRSWMSRGIAYVEAEDFRKAALDFTSVIKLKTDLADGWFNRAEALYHLGQFKQAASDYGVALSMDSDDAQSLTGRGHAYLALGQFKDALADYERVVTLHPKNSAALVNVGDACQRMGRWADAMTNFDKSVALKPTSVGYQRSAWLKATCPDKKFRDATAAIKLAKQAIDAGDKSVINLDTLAAAEAANGNFEVAKTTQEKVVGLVKAVEDEAVSAEDSTTTKSKTNVYQARLALYEQAQPFIEAAVKAGKKETPGPDDSTPESVEK